LGIHQLKRLDDFIEQRTRYAALYTELLEGVEGVLLPKTAAARGTRHAWHLYVILADIDRLDIDRDRFMAAMLERNIGIGLHFPAVHLQPYYRKALGCARGSLPKTEFVSDRIFSLPLYPGMSERDLRDVADAVLGIASGHRRTA